MTQNPVDPEILARLQDLQLIAQRIVAGGAYGVHTSKQRGAGMEFSQYRAYEPGDEPRHVDWKLFARSDRIFVRESERESQHKIWFLLDLTESMNQESGQVESWSKLRYTQCLTAALSFLARRQGDQFGLIGINDDDLVFRPCAAGDRQFESITYTLNKLNATGRWPAPEKLGLLWNHMQTADLSILISDFFQSHDEIFELAQKLSSAGKELIVVQLLTRDEQEFPYVGKLAFVDRESGETVEVDAQSYKPNYLERFNQGISELRRKLTGLGVQYEAVRIEDPLDKTLWSLLKNRAQLGRRRGRLQ